MNYISRTKIMKTINKIIYLNLCINIVKGMGAGICPISKFRNKIYILLGKERYNSQWSDFGGSRDGNENNINTAIREGYEELDGFLGNQQDMSNLLHKNFIHEIKNNKGYHSYLVKLDYDKSLPFYFNNHHKFIENNTKNLCGKNGLYEKKEKQWFTIDELKKLKMSDQIIFLLLIL